MATKRGRRGKSSRVWLPVGLGLLLCLGPACSEESWHPPDAGQEEDSGQDGKNDSVPDGENADEPDGGEDGSSEESDGCVAPSGPGAGILPWAADGPSSTLPTSCPDLHGVHEVLWLGLGNPVSGKISPAEFVQEGCHLSFNLDAIFCYAFVDALLNFYMECPGVGVPFTGKTNLAGVFEVTAGQMTTIVFYPSWERQACAVRDDPVCTAQGEVCGVVVEEHSLVPRCVRPDPAGRATGFACDGARDWRCANSLCVHGTCTATCEDDAACAAFPGSSCIEVSHSIDYAWESGGGLLHLCLPANPGETLCSRGSDCPADRSCRYRQSLDDVYAVCLQPVWPLHSLPVEPCTSSLDCSQGMTCEAVDLPDRDGGLHPRFACVAEPGACSRDADCVPGESCQVTVSGEPPAFVTRCACGGGDGQPDPGHPCTEDAHCFSGWCGQDGLCQGLCLTDVDCLPGAPECQRKYFSFAEGSPGSSGLDSLGLCSPAATACALDADCPPGQVCRADLRCAPQGPGTGAFGAPCPNGPLDCLSGLCLREAAPYPDDPYCSRVCNSRASCGGDQPLCRHTALEIEPGAFSSVPVCTRRTE
jgi:hypothetical protein